jgi:hypothetical protein
MASCQPFSTTRAIGIGSRRSRARPGFVPAHFLDDERASVMFDHVMNGGDPECVILAARRAS